VTVPPAIPWPGDRALAERYAALRHPALAGVEIVDLPDPPTGSVAAGAPGAIGAIGLRPRPVPAAADPPDELDLPDALRAVGEVALGLQALHDLGLAHGAVRSESTRSIGDRWLLDGVARPGSAYDRRADVTALGDLLAELAARSASSQDDPRVAAIRAEAADPGSTAADVGRTALALAARGKPPASRAAEPAGRPDAAPERTAGTASPAGPETRSEELDARRRRTRNRMVLVAALVVLAGAALLKLLDTHGIVKVPDERGRTQPAATADLRRAGLVPAISPTAAPAASSGTVVGQSPPAGEQVRPGRTVTLRVATAPGGSVGQ